MIANSGLEHVKEFSIPLDSIKILNSYFICNLCQEYFDTKVKLDRHKLKRHPEKHKDQITKCEFCDYTTLSKRGIYGHRKAKHPELIKSRGSAKPETYKCKKCSKVYATKRDLMIHYLKCDRSHVTVPILKCSFCDKEFVRNHDRLKHEAIHQERKFKCQHCDFTAATDKNLRAHTRLHSTGKMLECSECRYRFTRAEELYQHQLTCLTIEKPFECDICGQKHRTKNTLKGHMLRHGDRKHECDKCGKKFKTKEHLKNHRIRHDPIPRLKCKYCDYRTHLTATLNRHSKAKHKNDSATLELLAETDC